MSLRLITRLVRESDKRLLAKLAWNMGVKAAWSVQRYKRRLKKGEHFPPFLYVSVLNSCNLRCQGCWVDVAHKQQRIERDQFARLVHEAQAEGNVFFGIVGGEPFMHPHLLDMLADHPGCYFQVFTNGHFITDEVARRLRQMGNVTPLISIEGSEIISDERRGRKGVLSKSLEGIQHCLNNRLFTGVCTSLCQTNIDDLLQEAWIDRLIEMGVMYTWFHVYRPMGPHANPELSLTPEQQLRARQFVVDMRVKKSIIIVDAYFDHNGQALCPAATGITHHINPWGDVEPCPIVQFATDNIHTPGQTLKQKINGSAYLRQFRELAADTTRGCIVLERPDLLAKLVHEHGAKDVTARQTALAELKAMQVRTSQFNPTTQVPEKAWAYRWAKWLFFQDFGLYAGRDHSQQSAPAVIRHKPATDLSPAGVAELPLKGELVELQVGTRGQ